MFEEYGFNAPELGQCPHAPGTAEWKLWQKEFMNGQTADNFRYAAAAMRGQNRMAALKEQVKATRTEANDWHDSVMAELAPEPGWM